METIYNRNIIFHRDKNKRRYHKTDFVIEKLFMGLMVKGLCLIGEKVSMDSANAEMFPVF